MTTKKNTTTATTAATEAAQLLALDDARIFSGDLWCKTQATGFYRNLLAKQREDIDDSGWWQFPGAVLRHSEVSALYDGLLPRSVRQKMAARENYRNRPPEIDDGDCSRDVFDFLYKNVLTRTRFVAALGELLGRRQDELRAACAGKGAEPSALEAKFQEARTLFQLDDQESQVLLFLYLSGSDIWSLDDVFSGRRMGNEGKKVANLAMALGCTSAQASRLLGKDGNLRRFGLLDERGLDIDDYVRDFLSGANDTPLSDRFYSRFDGEVLPWEMHGKLAEQDGAVLSDLIRARKPGKGQNILLYGLAGTGKTAFAQSLAAKLGKELYFINQTDSCDGRLRNGGTNFRFAGLEVANLRLDAEKVIICVDECDKMLANVGMGAPFFQMFGMPVDRDGEGKGQLNAVLDSLKLTVIWIANTRQNAIDPSSRRRFDFNVYFDALSPTARRFIWDNALTRYGVTGLLSEDALAELSCRYPVNAGGIDVAVRNAAAVCSSKPEADFTATVMLYLRSHCNILNIADNLDGNQPARDYSLNGLNIKSGPKLERIVAACEKYLEQGNRPGVASDTPRLNLLLSGAPGTGKTEFVKYLAAKLGRPLNIKMASDLLDCYVGGTEQRIANAFREAAAEGSILFIDEGDAMLGSRAKAVRSWETSMVTTLLNQMENFAGIFVMATNFAQNLDPAAIRRFTFKLQFDYLDMRGKLHFYGCFFKRLGLPKLSAADREALEAVPCLTPGDFRNVRQQFFYLANAKVSNAEIIKALADEAANKDQLSMAVAFANQRKIGFEA